MDRGGEGPPEAGSQGSHTGGGGRGGDSARKASGESKTKGLSKSREPINDAPPANPLVIMRALLLSGSSSLSSDLFSWSCGNALQI
jgi:hypothetical protein